MLATIALSWTGIILILVFVQGNWRFLVVVPIAVFFAAGMLVAVRYRCPVCGTPLSQGKYGMVFAFPVKICNRCGTDLRAV
jgi:hypothetical protein